jgi:predicted transcriptional regulator
MSRNRRTPRSSPELSEFELSVLIALKHRPKATADAIRRQLPWPSDAFAVRTALLRLEERALVAHSIADGQILYQAVSQSSRDHESAPGQAKAAPQPADLL